MNNQLPFLLGKTCEVPRNKKKKVYRYIREELVNMAELVNIPITSQTSNNYLCETLRKIATDNNLNTYEDFEKYVLHQELQKYPSLNDFLMFGKGLNTIDTLFEGLNDINKFNPNIQKLGINSGHGFLYKLNYVFNGMNVDVILKSARESSTDNIYYEYLAGQCINEFTKYFPFFPKTYKLGLYNTIPSWESFLKFNGNVTLPTSFADYISYRNPINLDIGVKNSCGSSKYQCVFIQYLNLKETLYNNISKYMVSSNYSPAHYHHLTRQILLLYLIYKTLSKLANYFTHYDLHLDNIGIYEIPNNKCITFKIKTDTDILEIKSNILPIFIDFGRSYFNCENLNANLNSSNTLMKKVCSYDKRNPIVADRLCYKNCGDERGYIFSGNLLPDGSISATDDINYWINRAHRNISHDLRLFNEIKNNFNFSSLDNSIPYIKKFKDLLKNIKYNSYHKYGMPETISHPTNLINNIHDVANELESIIRLPEFTIDLNSILRNKDPVSYGTLDLDFTSGDFKEFTFEKL